MLSGLNGTTSLTVEAEVNDGQSPPGSGASDSGPPTRTVACVDVRVAGLRPASRGKHPKPVVLSFALEQIQKVVRSGDRICPMAMSRIAVEFAPVASGVPPQVLGSRLADAIGRSMPLDGRSTALEVSVGMAAPEQRVPGSDLTRRALSAAASGASRLGRATSGGAASTIVTVDLPLTPRTAASGGACLFQPIHRRSVYRYDVGVVGVAQALRSDQPRTSNGNQWAGWRPLATPLTVLIADPMGSQVGYPGLAATTAASIAESLGCRTASVAVSPDSSLAVAVDGVALDLVVLVLDGGWMSHSPRWSSSPWGILARLTTSYIAAGVPVVVVGAGAGAGALASCVAQGAVALPGLEQLPDALHAMGSSQDDQGLQLAEVRLPPRFLALVGLTHSERRVLYYLTEGWAAQEVADELVVSLTTVRSHIRSLLRKLGVRSQLAAVAIANSRDLGHHETGDVA